MAEQKDTDQVEINYRLTGAGWAQCDVTIGTDRVNTSASYLSDALGELANAIVDIKNGAIKSTARFEEEPGEYCWIFHRNDDQLRLLILWFHEYRYNNDHDEKGDVVLDAECSLASFLQAFVAALKQILKEHGGVKGYKRKWIGHSFPTEAYNKLRL